MGGRQVVLLNEWDKRSSFYKKWGIEGEIRDIAWHFPNSYQMGFFACCREILLRDIHSGGLSKENAEQLLCIERQSKLIAIVGESMRKKFFDAIDEEKLKLEAIRCDYEQFLEDEQNKSDKVD